MNPNDEIIIKSFQELTQICHDARSENIRPVESQVEGGTSQVPMFLPAVEDPNLKPLLLAWYYAGYYSGRYQAMQEMTKK
jgi:hypothetical protein